jgi:ABC-type uncharacterized transport system permease subunit
MNFNLDPWFMGGASLFAITSLIHLAATWREESKIDDNGPSLFERAAYQSFTVSLVFWALLLVCWLFHTGGAGATRLWFGLSAFAIGLSYRFLLLKIEVQSLGGIISALISLLGIFAYQSSGRMISMAPDLVTPLISDETPPISLIIHIALALAGLAAFAVSAAMSGLYLVVSKRLKSKDFLMGSRRLPSLTALDAQNLRGLLIGFPLYTGALLIGSAHAFKGSGHLSISYLVALCSWTIYGVVLQARLTAGWRGQKAAWLTLIAFIGLLIVAASYSFR